MTSPAAKIGARIMNIAGWLLIAWSLLMLCSEGPLLYMLISGQIAPGAMSYLQTPAPTLRQQGAVVGFGFLVLISGVLLRFGSRQIMQQLSESNKN